jgi:carboxymethylenebutenolidase
MTTIRTESVASADGHHFDATAVIPDGGGPGVLLLQEIYGVGDFLLDRARALADEGFVVLCPDVFWRVERNVVLEHDEAGLEQAFGYMRRFAAIDAEVTESDLLAALAHLRAMPEVRDAVAVMGYCLGGRLAYEVAVAGEPDACVSYYGSGIATELDAADRVTCPIIFHFGAEDPYIPAAEVEAVSACFAERPDADVHVQAGAGHAFENSFAPMFSVPEAAAASWPLTVAFLRRTLGQDR